MTNKKGRNRVGFASQRKKSVKNEMIDRRGEYVEKEQDLQEARAIEFMEYQHA